MVRVAASFLLAFAVAAAVIPSLIRLSVRRNWLDIPIEARRIHTIPVPRLGGVAVAFAAATSVVVSLVLLGADPVMAFRDQQVLAPLFLALSIVFATGLVDDLTELSARLKFTAQLIGACIIVAADFRIESIALAADMPALHLGILSIPVTVLWIVGVTNAINLIDGIDGLAGTFAVLALTLTIAIETFTHGFHPPLMSVAFIGALLGFLRFNIAPASIFLGDAGAMTIGFFLAVQIIDASTVDGGPTFAIIPLLILIFPLLDTALAMGRRWLRGDPISTADGRHIHHQLLSIGLTPQQTIRLIGGATLGLGLVGVVVVFAPPQLAFALFVSSSVLLCVGCLYAVRWLGYDEFLVLSASMVAGVREARMSIRDRILANEAAGRIRDAESFDQVMTALHQLTEQVGFLDVQVLDGDVHSNGPERQRISPLQRLPVRFDFPCAREADGKVEELILRLWGLRSSAGVTKSIEHIATRIGPALEHWIRTHHDIALPSSGNVPAMPETSRIDVERN